MAEMQDQRRELHRCAKAAEHAIRCIVALREGMPDVVLIEIADRLEKALYADGFRVPGPPNPPRPKERKEWA